MKLTVIIPAYNEKATILEILARVRGVDLDKEIIIVDDGSTDGTREILAGLRGDDVQIVLHPKNLGKGAAIRTAVQRATGDYVIIQDADLEYDPNEYADLLRPIEEGRADVVYGSRFQGNLKRMSTVQRIGNIFLTLLTNVLYRTTLSDMETCYKVIPRDVLQGLKLESRGFEFEPEVTAKLLRRRYRIVEVPITYDARRASEGKKIDWHHGFPAVKALIKYRFDR